MGQEPAHSAVAPEAITEPSVVNESEEDVKPTRLRLTLVSLALALSIFCSGLDSTIVATATPVISTHFGSITDIGWYGSAYLLTTCTGQLVYGKLYDTLPVKWVFLAAVAWLGLGSLACALAQSSAAFIAGRAIAGCGSAGIVTGTLIIVSLSVPRSLRPLYNGFVGGIESISMVVAPLIGGALTTNVSWRWCFWINLPICVGTMVVIFLYVDTAGKENSDPWLKRLANLNLFGLFVFNSSIVCLLLALQWGGEEYAWSNRRVIAVLVIFAVFFVGFWAFVEPRAKERAVFPPRIMLKRDVSLTLVYGFCNAAAYSVMEYYIPIWFQAVKGVSAQESGIRNIPIIIGVSISAVCGGIFVSRVGYYIPQMILGSICMAIASGFMTTWNAGTGPASWIGWQACYGIGVGMSFPQAFTVMNTVLGKDDIAAGMTAIVFVNSLGATVFLSVAQNVFASVLRRKAGSLLKDPNALLKMGATDVRKLIHPDALLRKVLVEYNVAVVTTFWIPTALICFHVFAAVGLPWRSIHVADAAEDEASGKDEDTSAEKPMARTMSR